MRARNIKPGFFHNETLAELPPFTRLLFAGLWLEADRKGRLEDRPKRIAADLFPYDHGVVDVDDGLVSLEEKGFILRYCIEDQRLIQILTFEKHQSPHHTEKKSVLPAPPASGKPAVNTPLVHGEDTVNSPLSNGGNPPDSLIHRFSDSLIREPFPQTRFADAAPSIETKKPTEAQIEQLYDLYPRKREKLDAKKAICKAVGVVMAGDPDHPAMSLQDALDYLAKLVTLYARCVQDCEGKYIPYPASWFNAGSFWDDERDWSKYKPKVDKPNTPPPNPADIHRRQVEELNA